jgi:preprotein translocase subunit SecG
MTLFTTSAIYGLTIATMLPVIAFFVLVIKYHSYKKQRIKSIKSSYGWVSDPERRQEYINDSLNDISNFGNWAMNNHMGKLYIITVLFVTLFATTAIIYGGVYDTRSQEGIKYHTMLAEREDIIDSGFERFTAGSFNKRFVEQQQYSINPNYKYNFTGDYDWFAIEPIKIK